MKKEEVEVVQALRQRIRNLCTEIVLLEPNKRHVEEVKAFAKETLRILNNKGMGADILKNYEASRARMEQNDRASGAAAFREGQPRSSCKYKGAGFWGWKRKNWLEGWDQAEMEEKKNANIKSV